MDHATDRGRRSGLGIEPDMFSPADGEADPELFGPEGAAITPRVSEHFCEDLPRAVRLHRSDRPSTIQLIELIERHERVVPVRTRTEGWARTPSRFAVLLAPARVRDASQLLVERIIAELVSRAI